MSMDIYDDQTFSNHLEAMGEESLWKRHENHPHTEVYRFLRVRGAGHAVCVRVERIGDQATLRFVALDGSKARNPGLIAIAGVRRLTLAQWDGVIGYLRKAKFWAPSGEFGDPQGLFDYHDLVEGVRRGEYRAVSRRTQSRHEYFNFWDFMLALSPDFVSAK